MLPSANSLNSLSQQMASIIGPAIGASIVALGGTSLAFGLDALSFFISAACILPIFRSNPALKQAPLPSTSAHNGLREGFNDLREGYQAVIASAWLWITIVFFAFVNVTSGSPMSVSLPLLIKNNLHADVGPLGLFTSMSSVGYVVGAIWLGSYTRIRRRGPVAYLATLLIGVAVAIFGLTTSIPLLAAAAFLEGLGMSVFGLIWDQLAAGARPAQDAGAGVLHRLAGFLCPAADRLWSGRLGDRPDRRAIGVPDRWHGDHRPGFAGLLHPAIRGLD